MFKNMGGLGNILKEAQQMQNRLQSMQEQFKKEDFLGLSGGETCRVVVSGDYVVKEIQVNLDEESKKSLDVELLVDLVQTATNQALAKLKEEYAARMKALTGSNISFPGLS